MPSVTTKDCFDAAWQLTKEKLFPIRFQFWLKWLFSFVFAGQLLGILGLPVPFHHPRRFQSILDFFRNINFHVTIHEGADGASAMQEVIGWVDRIREIMTTHEKLYPILGGIAVIGVILFLLGCWINARFQFVLVDQIIANKPRIKAPFGTYKKEGNSFFWWNVVMGGTSCLSTAFLLRAVFRWMLYSSSYLQSQAEGALHVVYGALYGVVIALMIGLIPFVIFNILFIDFGIPYMYTRRVGVWKTWKKIWSKLREQFLPILGYVLVRMVFTALSHVASILLFIFLGLFLIMLTMILFFLISILGLVGSIWMNLSLILMLILLVLLTAAITSLPFSMFLRTFSIYYFGVFFQGDQLLPFISELPESPSA